ncbi:MAG: helix-turn-helix transcriptional regulator [Pseudomonadota bacterium]|nr:helix-turn-helix transcriptional regulator [Pseudomonadota bacterium]
MPFTMMTRTGPMLDFEVAQAAGDIDFWFEHMARLYDIDPMMSGANTGRFEVSGFHNARGVLATSAYDRQFIRATRTHAGRIGNYIFVLRFLSGGAIGHSEDVPFVYRPGDVIINDYAREYGGVHEASEIQGVYLDKAELGLDASAPLPVLTFASTSTRARLLHNELDALFDPLLAGNTSLQAFRFERFLSCVKLAITGAPTNGDVRTQAREALKEVICKHIERNLASPELSTTSVLRQFGVSRATLYRMFESDGGVRNYIATRRLYHAVNDLSSSPHVRGQVHQVSEKWGFSSDANFSRSVRRVFGTTPGALFQRTGRRAQPARCSAASEGMRRVDTRVA